MHCRLLIPTRVSEYFRHEKIEKSHRRVVGVDPTTSPFTWNATVGAEIR